MCRVVDGEWMELTPDMMVHNKRSVIKWVEKHTAHYRSTGVKFENALDWVTQTRYGKSASEISTALGLGGSVRVSTPASLAGACRALLFADASVSCTLISRGWRLMLLDLIPRCAVGGPRRLP